nr:MAG TPA: hypothetical protein [Caudoviricetes sp.]
MAIFCFHIVKCLVDISKRHTVEVFAQVGLPTQTVTTGSIRDLKTYLFYNLAASNTCLI